MGIFCHHTDAELEALRKSLSAALETRLTQPSTVASGDRRLQYDQNSAADLRNTLREICAELARRAGKPAGAPIYLV